MTAPTATVVVVAAGRGERFGDVAKVLAPANGQPLLLWSLRAAESAACVDAIVVVAGPHTVQPIADLLAAHAWRVAVSVVDGGETRRQSVANGIAAVPGDSEIILVHDAARPLVTPELFERCTLAAWEYGAAIVAAPVTDTLKHVEHGTVHHTVVRDKLWGAQTPQGFRRSTIVSAIERTAHLPQPFTDEASLLEALGDPVAIVEGDAGNLKVTHREDLDAADALLKLRYPEREGAMAMQTAKRYPRTGIGYDVHRFADNRSLVLGGVAIPHERGLAGHSDADVLLHAIADALLGAASLGDIGRHFPPGDPRWKDADSRTLVRSAVEMVRQAGWSPVNIDATVIAEAPKVNPHAAAMRLEIREATGLPIEAISIKATTNEGLGFVGREEGIAAFAVATIIPDETDA